MSVFTWRLLISFESDVGTSRGTGGVNPARAGLLRSPIADSLDAATKFSQTLVLALRRPGRRRAEAERLPVTSRYQSRSSFAFGRPRTVQGQ
jgi:hypothetical protein